MGEAVAASHYESVELVLGIQVGVVMRRAAVLELLFRLCLENELYGIVMIEQLRDGHLKEAGVPGGDIVDHMGLFGWNDNAYNVIYHIQVFQRLHPGLIGDVSELILFFNTFLYGSPTALDIIHLDYPF